jgi:1-deoxy-D-xylulose-5-phosphate reductoisomerase
MKKRILVLGCTGSIGTNTLKIIRTMPELFSAVGLVAHTSSEKLETLAAEFNCPAVLTSQEPDGIRRLIQETQPDIAVNGIAGSAGLEPSRIVLDAGIDLALANKETVVMAWPLIQKLAEKHHCRILPVDSEHSALFNLIEKFNKDSVSELLITASGGPFRTYTKEQLSVVTVADALKHPTWKMGKKITIDSATLANKGLEVIEACRLFGFSPDAVKVVVHPQSIVHSLIRTRDGMLYAQLSDPDMKHPILSALTWPDYTDNVLEPFSLFDHELTFFPPKTENFPLLGYAFEAARAEKSYTIAYNAANEVAALAFIDKKIQFNDIPRIVRTVLDKDWSMEPDSFETVFSADTEARMEAQKLI